MADPTILVCIDFDKTLIDCNTDVEIKSLLDGKEVPEEIESLAIVSKGWTAYMRELFIFMHKNNVSKDDYIRCLTQLPLVPGMPELLNQMHDGCLQIREFQNQTSCKRCPPNLCKGAVLVTYLAKRMLEGVQFSRKLYIGDGQNDVCAALHLELMIIFSLEQVIDC
ncbi:pyridoxal phosphate phosphatase PHOSPHO2 [Trichonephila clavipes]|nr:pyridoxal phosphate phosphatase PHOSPHO2 [Trichonephila clavipes]